MLHAERFHVSDCGALRRFREFEQSTCRAYRERVICRAESREIQCFELPAKRAPRRVGVEVPPWAFSDRYRPIQLGPHAVIGDQQLRRAQSLQLVYEIAR